VSGNFGGDAQKQLHSHLTYNHHTLIMWAATTYSAERMLQV